MKFLIITVLVAMLCAISIICTDYLYTTCIISLYIIITIFIFLSFIVVMIIVPVGRTPAFELSTANYELRTASDGWGLCANRLSIIVS